MNDLSNLLSDFGQSLGLDDTPLDDEELHSPGIKLGVPNKSRESWNDDSKED